MDYVHRRLTLDVEICIGEPKNEARREVYRPAVVTIDDVNFLYVEPPRETRELHTGSEVRIDAGLDTPKINDDPLQHLRHLGPIAYIFLSEFNSLIYFSAGPASLEWTGPEDNRT